MFHGGNQSIGCYALGDDGIDEIFTICEKALDNGQRFFRVHIFPFRMTIKKMKAHVNNKWYPFWQNLKIGYDWFDRYKVPPNVTVRSGRYIFGSVAKN